jgi:FlaG/FlaF family flagellin (archaellin)
VSEAPRTGTIPIPVVLVASIAVVLIPRIARILAEPGRGAKQVNFVSKETSVACLLSGEADLKEKFASASQDYACMAK